MNSSRFLKNGVMVVKGPNDDKEDAHHSCTLEWLLLCAQRPQGQLQEILEMQQ